MCWDEGKVCFVQVGGGERSFVCRICWGVKHGIAENNRILNNHQYGISIGHRDTDNIIRLNQIEGSGEVGITFRNEPNEGRSPHRNIVTNGASLI